MNIQSNTTGVRRSALSAFIVSTIFLTSCATTPQSPQGAMAAREKLTALQENPTLSELARVEIREAEAAVRAAEKPLAESDAELGKHRVFMADHKVEIAVAKATTRSLESQREQLGEERSAARLQARTQEVDRARGAQAASAAEAEELRRQVEELEAEATDRGLVLTLGDVLFATGSADLQGGANSNLNKLVSFLNEYPERKVLIEGHTDNVGSEQFNQGLSQRRADSVRQYLVQQDISPQRMTATGIGQDRPVSSNETSTGRQQNRRVEIIIEHEPVSAARRQR